MTMAADSMDRSGHLSVTRRSDPDGAAGAAHDRAPDLTADEYAAIAQINTLAPKREEFSEFGHIFHSRIRPYLLSREAEREAAVRNFYQWTAGSIGLGALAAALISFVFSFGPWAIIAALVIGFGGSGFAYMGLSRLGQEIKREVFNAATEQLGLAFSETLPEPPAFDRFCDWGLLPSHQRKSFEDHFTGERKGVKFEFYEAKLEQRRRSKNRTYYVTVFQGVLFRIRFPLRFHGQTLLKHDKGLFNFTHGRKGLERVKLVDPEFERQFEVFGSDQVESRYLLTPDYMERLIRLETAVAGKKLRALFDQGDLLVAVEGPNRFEIGSMFQPLDDPRRLTDFLHELDAVFDLIDTVLSRVD